MEDASAGVVPPAIGRDRTPAVHLGAVTVDGSTAEAEVAVAAAEGVEAVDAGSKTSILASSYLTIPRPPLSPWLTALIPRAYRQTSFGGGGFGRGGARRDEV